MHTSLALVHTSLSLVHTSLALVHTSLVLLCVSLTLEHLGALVTLEALDGTHAVHVGHVVVEMRALVEDV